MHMNRRTFLRRMAGVGGGMLVPSVLAACGNASSGDTAPEPAGTMAPASSAGETTEMTLTALWWDWEPWNEAAKEIFERFRDETGIAVTFRMTPYDDLDRAIRSTSQQPDPPDIMLPDGFYMPTYAASGLLLPLDDIFPPEERADFIAPSVTYATWEGQFYGAAMDDASQGLYYNRTILERYNIEPPTTLETAWTWPEAREVFIEVQAKERERRGNDQFWALNIGSFGLPIGGDMWHGGMTIRSNGEPESPTYQFISEDGLTTDGYINTPEALQAYQFLQDLYVADELAPSTQTTDLFGNEQVAFWLANMSQRRYIQEVNPDLPWGVTPVPYHRTPIVHTASFQAAVSAFSQHPDAAKEAVKFLANPENGEIMARVAMDFPLRKSVWEEFPEYFEEPLKIFTDTHAQWGQTLPLSVGASDLLAIFNPMLTDIASGAPVEETVEAATRRIDEQLSRYANLVS